MAYDLKDKLTIAVTTRALFDLEFENKIFEEKGEKEYEKYQIDNEDKQLAKGVAFNLIESLLSINNFEETKDKVEVIIALVIVLIQVLEFLTL